MKKVYLAGPITGLTYEQAESWRTEVRAVLEPAGIECYSPLRSKAYFKDVGTIGTAPFKQALSSDRGILARDHWDCRTADIIFVNLLGATERGTGTTMEIAWGVAYDKLLVVCMEDEGNVHDHPMIREAIDFRFANLIDAVLATKAILLP